MKAPQKHENPRPPLSSSDLFVLMSTADPVSSYRGLFDRYWKKREEERGRPSEGPDRTKRRVRRTSEAHRDPQESRCRERKAQGGEDRSRAVEGTT
ncbi:MAG: hypothetical protein ACYDBP_10925 [Leptospirales bacterium]